VICQLKKNSPISFLEFLHKKIQELSLLTVILRTNKMPDSRVTIEDDEITQDSPCWINTNLETFRLRLYVILPYWNLSTGVWMDEGSDKKDLVL
jgi:hypothetical protein